MTDPNPQNGNGWWKWFAGVTLSLVLAGQTAANGLIAVMLIQQSGNDHTLKARMDCLEERIKP